MSFTLCASGEETNTCFIDWFNLTGNLSHLRQAHLPLQIICLAAELFSQIGKFSFCIYTMKKHGVKV